MDGAVNAILLVTWFWPDGELIEGTKVPMDCDTAQLWDMVREYDLQPFSPGVWTAKVTLDDGQFREAELQMSEPMHTILERWLEHTREGLDSEFPWTDS